MNRPARRPATDLVEVLSEAGAALLLDLDGTLIDSEPMIAAALSDYFASRGWDVSPESLERFRGRPGRESFTTLEGPWSGEDPDAVLAGVTAAVDPVLHPPRPIPGAVAAVTHWHGAGVPIALVTSAVAQWARQALELLGIAQCFSALITAEDVAEGKPSPVPFLRGAEALGSAPENCVVVEDSPAGILAARRAGVGRVVGVTTGLDARELLRLGADSTAADLRELVP